MTSRMEAIRILRGLLSLFRFAGYPFDCGDNSCIFAIKRGGMRTNGGCRCVK